MELILEVTNAVQECVLLFMKKIHVTTNTVPETEVRGILWLILTKLKVRV